ncbi:uncharacterized protein EV422DRAFT_51603 [Fimicolochytrium jonesii]|uniref:uncharacterized protein n=1 Tax=Fimicolochytrium jonesii TaxID=1396493 RepID=UPI0022FE5A54|nr:uncharacterized protein EV422DRAFT_51603 [Fimicolochytrium jonesii]KAI8821078.1 hypothetical protein EV422DRAFT_51603 [Fimicolochytrium jonesii]
MLVRGTRVIYKRQNPPRNTHRKSQANMARRPSTPLLLLTLTLLVTLLALATPTSATPTHTGLETRNTLERRKGCYSCCKRCYCQCNKDVDAGRLVANQPNLYVFCSADRCNSQCTAWQAAKLFFYICPK